MDENEKFEYHFVEVSPTEQIPLHEQASWELSYILLGEGERLIGDHRSRFTRGDLLLIPPGIRHCWYFSPDATDENGNIINISLMIDAGLLSGLKTIFPQLSAQMESLTNISAAIAFPAAARIRIAGILKEMKSMDVLQRSKAVTDIIFLVLGNLESANYIGLRIQHDESHDRLMQVKIFVSCNYMRQISTADMARHIGVNKSSFCAFFKKATGTTFISYLNAYRLDRALLLLGDKPRRKAIADICFEVGFQSVPHFNHLFRQRFGKTPKQAAP